MVILRDVSYALKNLGYLVPATVEGDTWSLGGKNDLAQIDEDSGMLTNYCDELYYWTSMTKVCTIYVKYAIAY